MSDSRTSRVVAANLLSAAIFLLTLFQLYQSTKVGTTPRGTPAREALQHLHISVGLVLLLLVLPRLWLWWRNPRPARPSSVPLAADGFARTICLLFLCTILAFCVTGPLFAWSEGHAVALFGLVQVPALLEKGYRAQTLLGYLHSAFGFWIFYLLGLALVVSIYQRVRYKAPLLRMLPAMRWSGSRS